MNNIKRRYSIPVSVGGVIIGGDAPIVVQSMTDTDTADAIATVRQVKQLADAGSELVRITVNTEAAASKVAYIRKQLDAMGCHVPLIGDFHYNGHTLLTKFPDCAEALAKYRINPGNVGFGNKKDKQFATMIEVALKYNKPVRIGVNWGSLDKHLVAKLMDDNAKKSSPLPSNIITQQALVMSALNSAKFAESLGLPADKIVISCKVSNVQDLISVYRSLADQCDYALHLGLTEAGMGSKSIVASSIAMGVLMQEGVGDTIRTSLTPEPGADRTNEVTVSQQMLQTMGLRYFMPMVTACPGCGRTTSSFFRELSKHTEEFLSENMPAWRLKNPGVETLTIAVMGCIVNGPGESKHANIGISLPGTGEEPAAPVFIDGVKRMTLRGCDIATDFTTIIKDYVETVYVQGSETCQVLKD